ncbi:MAG: orotidine-5'-phosphate decarboxylase [Johnsonella sp.]|nr:orotidine-5'-phosphate decarboxylase [Johnsonella sp.]
MISKLIRKIDQTKAPICVGLDPQLSFIPSHIKADAYRRLGANPEGAAEALWNFNREIIDEIYDLIPAVKPQIAMYEQLGIPGLVIYQRTVDYCKEKGLIVIGDAKRGDIGSTSEAYAKAHLGSTEIEGNQFRAFDTDMLTVNPYLGTDGIEPFTKLCREEDKGLFILVKTSNPSSGEFQDKLIEGRALYEHVAEKVNEWGENNMDGDYSDIGAVVGATYPQMSRELRKLMPKAYFLVPGYGAQGAGAKDLKPCFHEDGRGAIVNSSRGIIAAYRLKQYQERFTERDFAKASRAAVEDMIGDIHSVL